MNYVKLSSSKSRKTRLFMKIEALIRKSEDNTDMQICFAAINSIVGLDDNEKEELGEIYVNKLIAAAVNL